MVSNTPVSQAQAHVIPFLETRVAQALTYVRMRHLRPDKNERQDDSGFEKAADSTRAAMGKLYHTPDHRQVDVTSPPSRFFVLHRSPLRSCLCFQIIHPMFAHYSVLKQYTQSRTQLPQAGTHLDTNSIIHAQCAHLLH
jgi:hypothetical protein